MNSNQFYAITAADSLMSASQCVLSAVSGGYTQNDVVDAKWLKMARERLAQAVKYLDQIKEN
jgi:hypothetical protein